MARAPPSAAPPTSACTARSRPASTGSAWRSTPAGCRREQMRGLAKIAERSGRRRYPAHGLAEPPDLRRAGRQGRAGPRRHRRHRPLQRGQLGQGGARRLHRQQRLQVRRVRYQAARRGHRPLVRQPRGAGRARQHPPYRLPPLLRTALHRRHRPARLQGRHRSDATATRSRAITSWSAAASAPMPGSAARWPAT